MDATVVGALIALGGVIVGQVPVVLLDRAGDRRSLRDQRAQRLREAFLPVFLQVQALADAVRQRKWVDDLRQTAGDRARFAATLEELTEKANLALAKLELEPGADVLLVRAAHILVRHGYTIYMDMYRDYANGDLPPADRPTTARLEEMEDEVLKEVARLRDSMLDVLNELGAPVSPWPWKRRSAKRR